MMRSQSNEEQRCVTDGCTQPQAPGKLAERCVRCIRKLTEESDE